MKKKKKETNTLYDPCPLVDQLDSKQKGLFRLNGMGFCAKNFPEIRKGCKGCADCKEIPPRSYSCRRFYFTEDFID